MYSCNMQTKIQVKMNVQHANLTELKCLKLIRKGVRANKVKTGTKDTDFCCITDSSFHFIL